MQPKNLTQLAPRDAAFVYMERPTTPTNIVSVYVFDTASRSADPIRREDVVEWMRARLHTSELFRRRLVRVPGDLDHPYWAHDEAFDIRRHVFVTETPIAGWDALRRRITDLAETRFDLGAPPWQLHVFTRVHEADGLPADATVVVLKFHHSACDGIASVEIARKLFTDDLEAPPSDDAGTGRAPGPGPLLVDAVASLPPQIWKIVTGTRNMRAASREVQREVALGDILPPVGLRPRTRFDHKISGSRTFGVARFSLRDIRDLKAQAGEATVNDLMITVASLALTNYLNSLNELPDGSLAALVPMSTRKHRPGKSVNQFSPMFVDLHTQEPDPRLRLTAISESAQSEKRRNTHDAVIRSRATLNLLPGFAVRALAALSARLPDRGATTAYANTMITNVPRGAADLRFLGANATSAFGVLALEDYDGLCHLIASLGDEVTITFVSTPEAMPDPDRYTTLLHDAYEELDKAIRAAQQA